MTLRSQTDRASDLGPTPERLRHARDATVEPIYAPGRVASIGHLVRILDPVARAAKICNDHEVAIMQRYFAACAIGDGTPSRSAWDGVPTQRSGASVARLPLRDGGERDDDGQLSASEWGEVAARRHVVEHLPDEYKYLLEVLTRLVIQDRPAHVTFEGLGRLLTQSTDVRVQTGGVLAMFRMLAFQLRLLYRQYEVAEKRRRQQRAIEVYTAGKRETLHLSFGGRGPRNTEGR